MMSADRSAYSSWYDMKRRCYSQDCPNWPRYGGRGIVVCDRWLESFNAFMEDMGPKPSGYTIERINTDGNYEPSNCRWASKQEQRINQENSNQNKGATHCKNGHELINPYISIVRGYVCRTCRICQCRRGIKSRAARRQRERAAIDASGVTT